MDEFVTTALAVVVSWPVEMRLLQRHQGRRVGGHVAIVEDGIDLDEIEGPEKSRVREHSVTMWASR